MTFEQYLEKAEQIRKIEYMSYVKFCSKIDICYNAYSRMVKSPLFAALKSQRKVKHFVDQWMAENPGKLQ